MAIQVGLRLGPYEILSAIGAGGMGEVYRAKDTRLNRIVAIKVLPAHLADRPELRERFEREAKTIASLNHPHICTLYDIGHQDGVDYLVLEYLEGETLAQRLLKGPLGSTKAHPVFPPTGAGWPISRTNRAAMRFTCSPIRALVGSGKSRRKVGPSQCGTRTGENFSSAAGRR